MSKKTIVINGEKCVGCGLCASACRRDVIGIVDGKAKLLRADYCDGLGICLPVCPVGAISFGTEEPELLSGGCPGSSAKELVPRAKLSDDNGSVDAGNIETYLSQWPVQIKLVSAYAPYFNGSDLLVAADCAAYAYGAFHKDFIKGKITVIGCPKLDDEDYSVKLTEIFKNNGVKTVTVARMEVPCCGGIEHAVKTAIKNSGKDIPLQVATISTDGKVI